MTIGELKKLIENVDDNLICILQKDSEGNGYSPLRGVDYTNNNYLADSTYSGDVGFNKLTPELKKDGYTEEDLVSGQSCAVFYPIN